MEKTESKLAKQRGKLVIENKFRNRMSKAFTFPGAIKKWELVEDEGFSGEEHVGGDEGLTDSWLGGTLWQQKSGFDGNDLLIMHRYLNIRRRYMQGERKKEASGI